MSLRSKIRVWKKRKRKKMSRRRNKFSEFYGDQQQDSCLPVASINCMELETYFMFFIIIFGGRPGDAD
jgi:hypothetical protein